MRSLRTHSKLQGVGVGQGRDLERKEATTEGGGAEEGEQKEGGGWKTFHLAGVGWGREAGKSLLYLWKSLFKPQSTFQDSRQHFPAPNGFELPFVGSRAP